MLREGRHPDTNRVLTAITSLMSVEWDIWQDLYSKMHLPVDAGADLSGLSIRRKVLFHFSRCHYSLLYRLSTLYTLYTRNTRNTYKSEIYTRLSSPEQPTTETEQENAMSVLEKSENLLRSKLLKGNQAFNFKLLSRELDIHVNDAKKLLFTFFNKHRDLISATYVIVGTLRGDGKTIKITSDLGDVAKFDEVETVDVYSLAPLNVKIDEAIGAINKEVKRFAVTEEKLQKWGLVKGPELVKQTEKPNAAKREQPRSPPVTGSSSTASANAAPKKREFPDMGLRSAAILARNKKEKEEKEAIKKKPSQPTFGRSLTRPAEVKVEPVRRSKTEPSPKPRSEVVEDEELNDDEYSKKEQKEREEKQRKQKELESMFDDDDDDDLETADGPTGDVDKVEEVDAEADTPRIESLGKEDNKEFEDIFDTSLSQSQSQSQKPQEGKNKGKKELETEDEEPEQYYDEEGYLVTRKKAETKAKAKAKAAPAKRTSSTLSDSSGLAAKKTKNTTKQQSSLMNFFGKK